MAAAKKSGKKRKPGRPKGSKNKKKPNIHSADQSAGGRKRKPGRPKGSKNKKKKPGRPKGSKNKTTSTRRRKPGRPKGSKNKTTMKHGGKTITITLHGK